MKKKEGNLQMKTKNSSRKALIKTVRKMVPAVLIAMISTALGLLSLYRSDVPMIQDFGSMLTIGIMIAFAIALFVFLPFMFVKDWFFKAEKPKKQKKIVKHNRFIHGLTGVILKFRYAVIVVAVLIAATGIYFDLDAPAETDLESFMPQDSEALADIEELRTIIGSTEQLAIVFESENILLDLESIKSVEDNLLTTYDDIIIETTSITTMFELLGITDLSAVDESTLDMIPVDQRKLFINDSYTKSVFNMNIVDLSDEEFDELLTELETYFSGLSVDFDITVTGQSIIDVELMKSLTTGRYEITLIGLGLIFLSLFAIYRKFYRAILPLLPIILIVGWSGLMMYLFDMSYTPLTATLGALIMGIGTEFTILITERYEEEKHKQKSDKEAIRVSLAKMSNPILVSALTTMGGFSALIFSDFVILSNFGIMTLVNISLALISTLVVLPAILGVTIRKPKQTVHS
jgi:hydrophobe/amphiphile efflux-3 (HAE3) family protein